MTEMSDLPRGHAKWWARATLIAALTVWTAVGLVVSLDSARWFNTACVAAVISAMFGVAVFQFKSRPRWQTRLAHFGVWTPLLACFLIGSVGAYAYVDAATSNAKSQSKLKQIALAMHSYESMYGHLPPAAIRAEEGTPLLSWRVAMLQYLAEDGLYKQFHLDEPWDSPHNLGLLARMPAIYRAPGQNQDANSRYYQILVGKNTAFERDGLKLANFYNEVSKVLLVVDAADAVPWTKPQDVTFDDAPLIPKLGGSIREKWFYSPRADRFSAATADGAVQTYWRSEIDEATVRRMALHE
jgi:hypothetical protein